MDICINHDNIPACLQCKGCRTGFEVQLILTSASFSAATDDMHNVTDSYQTCAELPHSSFSWFLYVFGEQFLVPYSMIHIV